MKIRFQADYDFNGEVVEGLLRREPVIDIKSGHAAMLEGILDQVVLEKAAGENRILVTHDHRTMPHNFAEFISQHESPGVFIIPQHLSISEAIEELLLIWSCSEAEEWINRILYLPL
ncbi:MAG: DUF5615 family PIN-like protein [Blastocatellia bacterium]|nr:DUF5615 family PIN-like protein [Blastocatellia bacterium]